MGVNKTHEQFSSEVCELVGNEYELLDTYRNAKTKIKLKHNVCCSIFDVTPNNFLRGRRCPLCADKIRASKRREGNPKIKKRIFDLVGNEYVLLSDQIEKTDVSTPILHRKCGHKWNAWLSSFLNRGTRCPVCSNKRASIKLTKSHEKFIQQFKRKFGDEFKVLGKYKKQMEQILIEHKCGMTFEVYPKIALSSNFVRCPKCTGSKGEYIVGNFLKVNQIYFKTQFRFEECRHKNTLPFDFAVFENQKLACLIEYDGEQHFHAVGIFGGYEKFETRKLRDSIKNIFCKNNNIPLLRIPYTEIDNVEEIIKVFFKERSFFVEAEQLELLV